MNAGLLQDLHGHVICQTLILMPIVLKGIRVGLHVKVTNYIKSVMAHAFCLCLDTQVLIFVWKLIAR